MAFVGAWDGAHERRGRGSLEGLGRMIDEVFVGFGGAEGGSGIGAAVGEVVGIGVEPHAAAGLVARGVGADVVVMGSDLGLERDLEGESAQGLLVCEDQATGTSACVLAEGEKPRSAICILPQGYQKCQDVRLDQQQASYVSDCAGVANMLMSLEWYI
jgi:hypothetical protein